MFSKFYTSVPRWYLAGMFMFIFNYVLTHIYADWHYLFAFPSMISNVTDVFKLLVCSLISDELITLVLTLSALLIFERLIFRSWSRAETVFFLFIMMVLPPFMSAITVRLIIADNVIFYGGSAFVASVVVIATQMNADRFLFGYGNYGLKSKRGFCCGFLLYCVLSLIGFVNWANIPLFTNGFLCSWFYLRFLQHRSQRRYGDHRPDFAFAKFFPGPLEYFVAGPTNMVYRLLLRTNLCPSLERKCEIVSTASFAPNIPGLTAESDRHRRLALMAINAQLAKSQSQTPAPRAPDPSSAVDWPSIDDEPEFTAVELTPGPTSAVVVGVPTASALPAKSMSAGSSSQSGASSAVGIQADSQQQDVVVVHVGPDMEALVAAQVVT